MVYAPFGPASVDATGTRSLNSVTFAPGRIVVVTVPVGEIVLHCATPLSTFPTCCHVSVSGADERVAAAESLKLAMTVSVPAVAPA